ncbi:ankyrin unc44 [Seiridium cupressi]
MVCHPKAKHVSINIRASPDVETAIYTDGSAHIMKAATSHLNTYTGFDPKNEKVDRRSSSRPTRYDDDEQTLTWIHLPATNIKWMKDPLSRIMVNERSSVSSYHKVSSVFQSTWFETPDRTSSSRIMRPQFVENKPEAPASKRQED